MSLSLGETLTFNSVQLAFQITIFAIWGVGADLPIVLMRYGKAYPPVMNIHSISMMICGLLTIMYVLTWTIVYFTQIGTSLDGSKMGALIVGWILTVGLIIQGILGFVVRAELSSTQLSQNLFVVKWIHRILGVIVVLIGKVTVILNLYAYAEPNIFRGFLFFLGVQIIAAIVLQIIYRIQTKKCYFKRLVQHTPKHQKKLTEILDNLNSDKDMFEDYKSKGIRYVILDNIMYYIDEDFIHPGGQVIFDLFNGQQINYLFKGTHQLTPDYPRHKHTKYARRFLDMRYVGDLKVTPLLLNQKVQNQLIQWKIMDIKSVYGDSNLIYLQNPDVIVDDALKVDQFGKYIMLRCPTEELIRKQYRPYSILKCLSKINTDRLQKYKNQYKHYIYGDVDVAMESSGKKSHHFQSTNSIINSVIHGANNGNKLSFMIKNYPTGIFSTFLVKNKNSKPISITGPFGRGLRLKAHSSGFFVVIAAGTGVLPFIDLFAYLLQKTLLKVIARKSGEIAAKRVNDQGIDYSPLQGLKILFIGAFENSKQFYMNEVIKDLYHLNKKHNLNQFDMMLRYNNNETEPDVKMVRQTFNSDFLRTIIDMQPERIYYCGPSNIQRDIRLFEKNLDQFKGTFIYV